MQNDNFFLLVLFIGAGYFYNACAMEGQNNLIKTRNDIVIGMNHYWSQDYSNNIDAIKNANLKSIRVDLKKDNYLPAHANVLEHLLYLSTIRKDNKIKTPFTQKQQAKFDTAFKIKRSVPWCFAVNGVVIGFTALFPFINFAGLAQCSNSTQSECLSQTFAIMAPTTTSVVGALVVGFMSLYATGLSPDFSSRKADKVQDEIGHLSHKYATIAKYWIDIYFKNTEQACYIANKFDIEELKLMAQKKTYKAKLGSSLITPLEEAWHFIKHNTVLVTFTEIENYIYNKIYSKQLEELRRKVEFLEQRLDEKQNEMAIIETKSI